MRDNTGDNGALNRQVFQAIVRRPDVDKLGNFYVLIGPKTFSAAQMLVNLFEEYTNVLFVGTATGSSPTHFGDSQTVRLVNSGLTLRVSTRYWPSWADELGRQSFFPHIPVAFNADEFFAGRDPVLQAALGYPGSAGIMAVVGELLQRNTTHDLMSAIVLLYKHGNDPDEVAHDLSAGLAAQGRALADEGNAETAARFLSFVMNDLYPRSTEIKLALADVLLTTGDRDGAREILESALRTGPGNSAVKAALDEMRGD